MDQDRAAEGSGQAQQPGVTPADTGDDVEQVSPEEISIAALSDVAAPAGPTDETPAVVNADLFDDPDEMARAIEEATGQKVEVVSESEISGHEQD